MLQDRTTLRDWRSYATSYLLGFHPKTQDQEPKATSKATSRATSRARSRAGSLQKTSFFSVAVCFKSIASLLLYSPEQHRNGANNTRRTNPPGCSVCAVSHLNQDQKRVGQWWGGPTSHVQPEAPAVATVTWSRSSGVLGRLHGPVQQMAQQRTQWGVSNRSEGHTIALSGFAI